MVQHLDEVASNVFEKELKDLKKDKIPSHIAIIMDGNRRWAKEAGLHQVAGHWEGAQTLKNIVTAATDIGIRTLTVYAFSTENWCRSPYEINGIFEVLEAYLLTEKKMMIENGVSLHAIGDLSAIPANILDVLQETQAATAEGKKLDLVLALNYGSRDEIRRAIIAIAEDYVCQKIEKKELTEKRISQYLDTAKWQDPDLLIRTSGEMRLSNFLLWQICYSEVYVTETLWPDFSSLDLIKAIKEYQSRNRRWGG